MITMVIIETFTGVTLPKVRCKKWDLGRCHKVSEMFVN